MDSKVTDDLGNEVVACAPPMPGRPSAIEFNRYTGQLFGLKPFGPEDGLLDGKYPMVGYRNARFTDDALHPGQKQLLILLAPAPKSDKAEAFVWTLWLRTGPGSGISVVKEINICFRRKDLLK